MARDGSAMAGGGLGLLVLTVGRETLTLKGTRVSAKDLGVAWRSCCAMDLVEGRLPGSLVCQGGKGVRSDRVFGLGAGDLCATEGCAVRI